MNITVLIWYRLTQVCESLTFTINGIPYDPLTPPNFPPGTSIVINAIDNTLDNCCIYRWRIQLPGGQVMITANPLITTVEESLDTPGYMNIQAMTKECTSDGTVTFNIVDHCNNQIQDAVVTFADVQYWINDYWPFPNPGPGIRKRDVEHDDCTNESWQIEILDQADHITIPVQMLCDRPCTEPCTPKRKNIETLTAKANCICSRFQVEAVQLAPEVRIRVVLDTCTPADPMNTMFGFPFQEITMVINPDYLLSIMECICATGITSEYVIPW